MGNRSFAACQPHLHHTDNACRSDRYPLFTAAAQAPRWIWIGGLVGALYVTGALIIAPMLGAANFIVAIILGQLLASAALDQWGLMGFPKQPVTPTRVIGLSVVFVGILVMQWQTIIGSSSRG